MKKFFTIIATALMMCSFATAQTQEESLKARKKEARQAKSELNQRASRDAQKMARTYKKEGWLVAPGDLPLEKQLDKSYMMRYEYEESGLPKYIFGQAKAVGSTYDAAKMQAVNNAKIELAGYIETQVTALTESTLGNSQISPEQAASINEAVQAGKSLIANKLGRVIPVINCYRNPNKNAVEVQVRLAYNTKMAMEAVKDVVRAKLQEKGKDLHEQLDKMWTDFK